jgi:proline iminopeptidase
MRLKRYLLLILVPLAMRSQNEHTIDSGDSTLHFRTFGTGKPLLIINGGPGMNSEGFSGIAAELSKLVTKPSPTTNAAPDNRLCKN